MVKTRVSGGWLCVGKHGKECCGEIKRKRNKMKWRNRKENLRNGELNQEGFKSKDICGFAFFLLVFFGKGAYDRENSRNKLMIFERKMEQ